MSRTRSCSGWPEGAGLGEQEWVRAHGTSTTEQVIVVHLDGRGPVQVALHLRPSRAVPGSATTISVGRRRSSPASTRPGLATMLSGSSWPSATAPASGWVRPRRRERRRSAPRWETAVTMAKVAGNTRVDWALGHAAVNGRFGHKDLASILNAHPPATTRQAGETRSLAQGTSGWARIADPAAGDDAPAVTQ